MSSTATTPTPKKTRIVILEDEPLLADLYELCLRDWFESVAVAKFADGNEACRELSKSEPDMFIMDWAHPGINGHEILEQLAARKAEFFILLTSDLFTSDINQPNRLGFKLGYLPKPFGVLQFWRALNEFIGPSDFPERQALLSNQELC
jgi:CheY-like chemotaxis protein